VYDVNLKVSLPTTANSFHLVYGLQVYKHFHLAFCWWGMAGLGDYAYFCVHTIFLVDKVMVSTFTHAAIDLIDPQTLPSI
jgi:hypothetical protein